MALARNAGACLSLSALGVTEPNEEQLAGILKEGHEWLSWAMAALVLMHMAAALKHHFVDRDATMVRMWWSRRRA